MRDRPAAWTLGIVLVCVGAVVLVGRYGGWEALRNLLRLWPLILVYLGLRMIVTPRADRRVDDAS